MPSQTFNGVAGGGWQTFNVPNGVTSVTVDVRGGGSGSNDGGRVTGRLAVTDSQVLYLAVGKAGQVVSGATGGNGGWPNGGDGGNGYLSGGGGGGDGGGGASYIRINSTTGTLKCVAAGAGGNSGDNGTGGEGGASTGQNGSPGTSGSGSVGNASGGTQTQGGNGGTSSSGAQFAGGNAADTALAKGGQGAQPSGNIYHHGGGGGGGGYRSGGGGQASSAGFAPGGGGGGGSNYSGGLTGATSARGGGGTGDGQITITWVAPPPANQPPSPPTSVQVNNVSYSSGMATKATSSVEISAIIDDADAGDRVRLLARRSTTSSFSSYVDYYCGPEDPLHPGTYYGEQAKRHRVEVPVALNTRYYVRLYTQDEHGRSSTSYTAVNFWTNRKPTATLTSPADNATFPTIISATMQWSFSDPDPSTTQKEYAIRYRAAATPGSPAGPWVTAVKNGSFNQHTFNPYTFRSNTFYEWTVKVRDEVQWSDWAPVRSFYSSGVSTPPRLLAPVQGQAIPAPESFRFQWRFIDPTPGDIQCKADLRYRVVGTGGESGEDNWVTLLGNTSNPGDNPYWDIPGDTFVAGFEYEWQARTYDGGPLCALTTPSDWSESARFWATYTPGFLAVEPVIDGPSDIQGALGCGTYRVFVYDRGGQVRRGEITPIARGVWERKRDDISSLVITTNGFGEDCCTLLSGLRSWMHELVVFRDGERVWEGPITRIGYKVGEVEIEAKDVMAYLYRRIMRQGYDDSYKVINGQQVGLRFVTERAMMIAMNALAPDDPNVLPYLTVMQTDTDARQSRVMADYSRTAWEEIDDLAATAGLDYTTVGRRIILWDTHKPIGKLPEMRDGDFSEPPVVTEYGMLLSNYFAVTNGSGVWGAVTATEPDEDFPEDPEKRHPVPRRYYGMIEQLASAYGEAAGGGTDTLTPAQTEQLRVALRSQAARNISGRWPTPLVVRVPDNAALNPEVNVGINQLVPGVWIPLRATGTCRPVAQMQKLDSVSVEFASEGESVRVVMSPAPDEWRDPDADAAAEEAG